MSDKLTNQDLINYLDRIMINKIQHSDEIIMYQGCKKYGITKRTAQDSGLCDDPECVSCRFYEDILHETLAEEASEFVTKNDYFMEGLTKKQLEVLNYFKDERRPITPKDAAIAMGYTESSHISGPLKKLTGLGYLIKRGEGRYTTYEYNADEKVSR